MEHVSELLPAIAKEKGFRKCDLKLAEAATLIRQNPPDSEDLAFMAKELVQCTSPHRDPGNVEAYVRRNGNLTLVIRSGWDAEKNCAIGYPYGSIPRLLLFWLTGEAVRTHSRRIRLGNSFYSFLKELGFDPAGSGPRSDRKRVKKQIRRLFACFISLTTGDSESTERRVNMVVADASELWWSPVKPEQADLWESWVELGEKFFLAITASPVPLDCRALKALKRSPLALDLYAWACHKAYSVNRKQQMQFVPWKGLHTQFGSDYSDIHDFRKKALAALKKIAAVYPEFHFECIPYGLAILPTSHLAIAPTLRTIADQCRRAQAGQEPVSPYQ